MTPQEIREAIDSVDISGEAVKALREHLDMTRVEFGRALGAPVQEDRYNCRTVERWERHESKPGWKYRQRLQLLAEAKVSC